MLSNQTSGVIIFLLSHTGDLLIHAVKLTFHGVSLWDVYGVYSSDHVSPTGAGRINGEQCPLSILISITSHYGLQLRWCWSQVNPPGCRSYNPFWKTSLHCNAFRITGPLWEKSIGHWFLIFLLLALASCGTKRQWFETPWHSCHVSLLQTPQNHKLVSNANIVLNQTQFVIWKPCKFHTLSSTVQ